MTSTVAPRWLSEVLGSAALAGTFFGPTMQLFELLAFDEAWSWGEVAGRTAFFAVAMGLSSAVFLRFSVAARERAAVERVHRCRPSGGAP